MPEELPNPLQRQRRVRRAIEFLVLFAGVPLFFTAALAVDRVYARLLIPSLVLGGAVCLAYLLLDKSFDRAQLWNWRGARAHLPAILLRFVIAAPLLAGAVLLLFPDSFLSFPRRNTTLWALVMLLYPIFSVYPQELMFRAFLFQRYAPLFTTITAATLASAAAFGFGHIILNSVAVALCIVGGLLFARTYAKSRSLLAASIEHALYGDLLFTIGFGRFLYLGAQS